MGKGLATIRAFFKRLSARGRVGASVAAATLIAFFAAVPVMPQTAAGAQQGYTLTIKTSPQGGGTVVYNPNKKVYAVNELVAVAATPASGYVFTGWAGAAAGMPNPGTLIMDGNKALTANFQPVYTLTVTASPPGGGTAAYNPNKTTYMAGERVTIAATPAAGYTFTGWGGSVSGAVNPGTITMNGNKAVTANFQIVYTLTAAVSPPNGGSVAYSPNKALYAAGESVTITATPAAGYMFTGWGGNASGTANPGTVKMDGNKAITAGFQPGYALAVNAYPPEGGAVTCNPAKKIYPAGEVVAIVAAPAAGYMFTGWSGGATGAANPLAIVMDGGKTLTANFSLGYTLAVAVSPPGSGSVVYSPNRAQYAAGETVTLSAAPVSGYVFAGWGGGASGKANPVAITMNGNKAITANFSPGYTLAVNVSPPGGGAVACNPEKKLYAAGEQVAIAAVPAGGYAFSGWTGNASGTANPWTVTMDGSKMLTANFQLSRQQRVYALTTGASPPEGGVVSPGTWSGYEAGSSVTVTATPASGYKFTGWTGASASKEATVIVTMDADKALAAKFARMTVPYGTLHDRRDGKTYNTITVGDYTWMAENLNFQTPTGSWCGFCEGYGRQYDWEAAKKACPAGWRLPTRQEWGNLVSLVGGNPGKKLKTNSGWNKGGNGSDEYGFSALPGGYRRAAGDFLGAGANGYWWSATESGANTAYYRYMNCELDLVGENNDSKNDGMSVRCVYEKAASAAAPPAAATYTVTVSGAGVGASGAGAYAAGATVTVSTGTPPDGKRFKNWTATGGVIFAGANLTTTAFIMPATAVTVTANFDAIEYGSLRDPRDGKTYKTINISGKTWMAQNLNFQTPDGSACYGDAKTNCDKYGMLYNWAAAVKACPAGWRLPARQEWDGLATATGEPASAGKKLKSVSGWKDSGNGSDDYGFSAQPGGGRLTGGIFNTADYRGYWWSATEAADGKTAYSKGMQYSDDVVSEGNNNKANGFSVRCVKD